MARSGGSGAGCGCLVLGLFFVGFPLAAGGVGLLAFALAAPAVVPYLLVTDPALFEQNRLEWLVALAASPLLVTIHLRDRWFPPGERVEPVTVETVRKAATQASEKLQQVRAENKKVSQLARAIEAQLLAASSEMDFVSLRNLHHESFGCADRAYEHYSSADSSLQTMSRILLGVRAALTLRLIAPRNSATGRRERPDRDQLKAAASSLSESRQQLDVEVKRGLTLVKTLNANTAQLKHSINDNCGERGRRWYQDLELRIEAARSREQQSPRAARR
ncbi:MAG: hypothetical protein ACRDTF_24320 [Pseudonocardiaceae bacterium]